MSLGALAGCRSAASIEVRPEQQVIIGVGSTAQFSAVLMDADSEELPGPPVGVSWSSTRPDIASVTSAGLVTARGPGEATIAAQFGNLHSSATVVVHILKTIVGRSVALAQPGDTDLVAFLLRDETGSPLPLPDPTLSVVSSNPDVATVSAVPGNQWIVTGLSQGQAQLTASAQGLTSTFTVQVGEPDPSELQRFRAEVSDLHVSPSRLFLGVGESRPLTVTAKLGGVSFLDSEVTFSSSNLSVATVSQDGTVTGSGRGTATITVAAGLNRSTTAVIVNR
jgi:uncharacterized protein YjdB